MKVFRASPLTVLLVLLHSGCSRGTEGRAADAGPQTLAAGATAFSREAFAPPPGDAGAGELPVPVAVEPAALDEILAAAPRRPPDAVDRGALIGTDTRSTGVAGDGGTPAGESPADAPRSSKIQVGKVTVEPGMSSPAIERAARAQLYWPLVQRCRDPDGAILPPEVVHLAFHLDRDGYVIPATILAVPKQPRFADAARCMARELSMATFRAPAAARGLPQNVLMDVPSVD